MSKCEFCFGALSSVLWPLLKILFGYMLYVSATSYNFHHTTCHEQGNQLLGKVFFSCPSSLQTKINFMIDCICFDVMWTSALNLIYMYPGVNKPNSSWTKMSRFLLLVLSFTKKEVFKKLAEFFQYYFCQETIS